MANSNLARKQIIIPATQQPEEIKLRVAAYCRVSTDSDDQLNSFAAQNNYYTSLISSKENWQMVDIYADEGITGTSAKKRPDFQRLLADCRKGRIDKVLVKSISRFARNTKECLEAIRELKSLGISVCFEEQHIDTKTASSEMLTAVMAAAAQAESESISKNIRWGIQKKMENGTFVTAAPPYGYRRENGQLIVHENEATIVRQIFSEYLSGVSPADIAKNLTANDQNRTWNEQTVKYILKNERYAGNALFQKRFTSDTLPYTRKKNCGERAMYFVHDANPAIVSDEAYHQAQQLFKNRTYNEPAKYKSRHPFGTITCGCCGRTFKNRMDKGIPYLVCRTHAVDASKCTISQIPVETILDAFLRLYYNLKHHSESFLSPFIDDLYTIRNRQMLWNSDVIAINKEISDITSQSHTLALLNQQGCVDPDVFISKTNQLAQRLRAAKRKKENLLAREDDDTIEKTRRIMETLQSGPDFLDAFSEELFRELVDKTIVESNTRIRFRLINGLELPERIERTVR